MLPLLDERGAPDVVHDPVPIIIDAGLSRGFERIAPHVRGKVGQVVPDAAVDHRDEAVGRSLARPRARDADRAQVLLLLRPEGVVGFDSAWMDERVFLGGAHLRQVGGDGDRQVHVALRTDQGGPAWHNRGGPLECAADGRELGRKARLHELGGFFVRPLHAEGRVRILIHGGRSCA